MSFQFSRRNFLGATLGAGAVAASPWFWVKKSFAQTMPAFGSAKHLIILYAAGGLRTSPLFFADASFRNNPFGKMNSTSEWGVGTVLGQQRLPLFSIPEITELPTVADIAGDIAVLAGVDHEPGTERAIIDHVMGDFGVCTGEVEGEDAGILSRIHRDHPGFKDGSINLPPIDIGLSNMGRGEGDYAGYRPIAVQSAEAFRGRSQTSSRETPAWSRELRLTRDERFIGVRAPYVAPYLNAVKDAKINAREYAEALRNRALDIIEAPDAELGGVTNQQLVDVLGASTGGGGGFPGQLPGGMWGLETAFSLRMMQLGVPAVSIMRYLYDTHSDEKTTLPLDAGDLGRQLSGLHFLLKRMRGSDGNPLWDKTVVVVMSEFSRDNVDPSTGFNTGNGSDHMGGLASRNQCWPIFGGPLQSARGKRIGGLDPETLNVLPGKRIATVRSVHATLLALLGIDPSRHFGDAPIAELLG